MSTKTEDKFIELANRWLAENLGNEDVRTVVWNGISALCNAIKNEKHAPLEVLITETQI